MNKATFRNLILASLGVLLAAGGFSFMVFKINSKEQELQGQVQALNDETVRENAFYKLQKTAEESVADRDRLAKYFLKQESDSIDVLNWVEGMAPRARVELQTKSLQKVSDKDTKTDWIEVSFAFTGEQHDVERFVSVLERLPYLSYITSLSLTGRPGENWQALVTLRVYIFNYAK
jgi:hypothetical protein